MIKKTPIEDELVGFEIFTPDEESPAVTLDMAVSFAVRLGHLIRNSPTQDKQLRALGMELRDLNLGD